MKSNLYWTSILAILVVGIAAYNAVNPLFPSPSQDSCYLPNGSGSLASLFYGQHTPGAKAQVDALVISLGCGATLTGNFRMAANNTVQTSQTVKPEAWLITANGTAVISSAVAVHAEPSSVPTNGSTPTSIQILASGNSKGFYFVGLYGGECPGFRLAVGYNPSQVSLSNWPGGGNPFRGCYPSPVLFEPTRISGASLETLVVG
jgi:hypothetical protein